ncbi:hypothetical protein CsSME_00042829 [Camellia sinensis var. sinensis]
MRLKSPTEDDYLGIYSIMFWTLSLIGVVKYACIALRADDQGEGGTFALYSLLCRNLDIGILSSKRVALNSSSEKQSRLGIFFEKSVVARRVLLFIAMLGMCMLIGDGILTPAISVLSAMDGIRAPSYSVCLCVHRFLGFQFAALVLVEVMSAVVLIVLFLLQKYGTSRVSFIFSPIMGTWTITTPLIGIYSDITTLHRQFFFLEMERKAGYCLVAPSFASPFFQVRKHCLLILVISIGNPFS